MKKAFFVLLATFCVVGVYAQECGPFNFRSYNILDSASAENMGADTFEISQDYPAELPKRPAGGYGFEKGDFRTAPMEWMKKLRNYIWAGMEEANFVAQNNKVRTWYHMPWMDYGYSGREYLRGLVMDRTSFPNELASGQTKKYRNYSVTYYNDAAGYQLGKIWCDPARPDMKKALFPIGSVVFKMIFTTADTTEVPWLDGALEWEAFIEKATELPVDQKDIHKVRLAQVNVAVRTKASEAKNGWVFGVYVYDGRKKRGSIKDRLTPIGVQWGNDPGVTPKQVRDGEKPIAESWINTNAWIQDDRQKSLVQRVGWGYRLQGPIGNSAGSIMSEAMTAGLPPVASVPPSGLPMDSILLWHRNIPSGQPFDEEQSQLDYSLELRDAIRNKAIFDGNTDYKEGLRDELAEALGFLPPDPDAELIEDEEEVIDFDEGLEGRNLFVFIGFLVLVLVMIGLLVRNIMTQPK